MLFFPTSTLYSEKYLDKVRALLESLQFEDITGKDVLKLNEKEFVFKKQDLIFKEREFAKYEIYAQCGDDSDFVTYLTDKIFRDSFKLNDDYKIKVKLSLNG
ncbi:MAG: hypothetical protein KAI53_04480 [Candidatus Aenigmarchaeota archaeon]|nr:hypothetical protein [Candidatus Aenigmarchaeota archaeon]